jgi:2-polyprenyl-6-methoxyphenol hydroxylase-like FAD-dependent oxidoreductase
VSETVVIVGAGPAGAGLALLLATRGIPVTLIERQQDFAREFRGEVMTPGGLAALEAMGVDVERASIPHQRPSGLEVFVEGRRRVRLDASAGSFGGRTTMTVSQPALLEHLVGVAGRANGFTLLRGASVHDLVRDGSGRVTGVACQVDGEERRIDARLVVGADGRSSVVRRRGGFHVNTRDTPMDVAWTRVPAPESWGATQPAQGYVGDGHLLLVFPAPEGGLQVGWIILKGEFGDLRRRGIEEWVLEMAAHAGAELGRHLRENASRCMRPFLLRAETDRVAGWAKPGVVLIGDAAHTMSPVGGQGINVALRDAIVAANHLVPALRDGDNAAVDRAAAAIEAERGPEIDTIQEIAAQPPRIVLRRGILPSLLRMAIPLLLKLPPVRAQAAKVGSLFLAGVTEVRLEV